MASSAASPVPIQTYNYLRRLSLTKEHFRLAKKTFVDAFIREASALFFVFGHAAKTEPQMTLKWTSGRVAVPLPPPRDAGHLDARN